MSKLLRFTGLNTGRMTFEPANSGRTYYGSIEPSYNTILAHDEDVEALLNSKYWEFAPEAPVTAPVVIAAEPIQPVITPEEPVMTEVDQAVAQVEEAGAELTSQTKNVGGRTSRRVTQ